MGVSDFTSSVRILLCVSRFLDSPEVVYPDYFDESKGRDLAERGFVFKYLGNSRDHAVRVVVVPITALALSGLAVKSLFTLFPFL